MTSTPVPREDSIAPDLTGIGGHYRGPEGSLTPRAHLITAAVGFTILIAGALTSTGWAETVGSAVGWINLGLAGTSWVMAASTRIDAHGVSIWQRIGPASTVTWTEVSAIRVARGRSRLVLADHRELVLHGVPRKVAQELAGAIERCSS